MGLQKNLGGSQRKFFDLRVFELHADFLPHKTTNKHTIYTSIIEKRFPLALEYDITCGHVDMIEYRFTDLR
jgi:hypothetical protein